MRRMEEFIAIGHKNHKSMTLPHSGEQYAVQFSCPAFTGREGAFVQQAVENKELVEGEFNSSCLSWLCQSLGSDNIHLTPSCTHALEMAALLLDIKPGDEIIMPSYTFVSAANAFVLRGGIPVFVDIRPDTMNIDETLIDQAITPSTKAIMVMHYAGVACEMEHIASIAARHRLPIIEDAAHGLTALWRGRPLGTLGEIGTFSFHQTKNFTGGEGGAILTQDAALTRRAGILRHKGTNRTEFLKGNADKYTWVDLGSSWAMNELNAAYLYGNLLAASEIGHKRHEIWSFYAKALRKLQENDHIDLPFIPSDCRHNAHIFYIKVKDLECRTDFLAQMRSKGIQANFHYVPLHTSAAGKKYGRFHGKDQFTTSESERLVRLPLFYNMSLAQAEHVVSSILDYYAR